MLLEDQLTSPYLSMYMFLHLTINSHILKEIYIYENINFLHYYTSCGYLFIPDKQAHSILKDEHQHADMLKEHRNQILLC
jgi:hypothetical protein